MAYKEIQFNELLHEYKNDKNEKYTSVTTLIKKYTEDFDTDFWSMYTALKNKGYRVRPTPEKQLIMVSGVEYTLKSLMADRTYKAYQDLVKAQWKVTTEEACIKGSNTHNKLEDNINISKGDKIGNTNKSIQPKLIDSINPVIATVHDLSITSLQDDFPFIYKRLAGYIERGCSIYAEKKVHIDKYKVAGMIDVPIFKGNKFCILDWKTNKDEVQQTAGYYKKENIGGKWIKTDIFINTDDKFKYPLNYIPASTFHKFALQLSTYAYILEEWGYELMQGGLEIIHIRDNKEPKIIKIPYLKKEVQMMLEHNNKVA